MEIQILSNYPTYELFQIYINITYCVKKKFGRLTPRHNIFVKRKQKKKINIKNYIQLGFSFIWHKDQRKVVY